MKETIQFGRDAARHPDADQISAFVEQALSVHEREELLAHLAVCTDCRATVAMSLPEAADLAGSIEEARRPWFARWGVILPAGALVAGMVVLAVYLKHEGSSRIQKGEPVQMATSQLPETEKNSRNKADSSAPAVEKEQESAEKEGNPARSGAGKDRTGDGAERRMGKAEMQRAPVRKLGAPAQAYGFATQEAPGVTVAHSEGMVRQSASAEGLNAATAPSPAAPAQEVQQAAANAIKPSLTAPVAGAVGLGNGAAGEIGGPALRKAEVVAAQLRLPSGLAVLSLATHGQQVLAIDSRNVVFLSVDAGAHWRAVPVGWTGRAVKANLVSYGGTGIGTGAAQGGRMASFASVNRETEPLQAQAVNPPTEASAAVAPTANADMVEPAFHGKLTGTVADKSGAAIPGATVTASDQKNGAGRTVVTDRDGAYLIDGLTPGTYDLKVQAQGFEQQATKDVAVKDVHSNVKNVTLNVGAASQSVTVEAANPSVDVVTDSMTLSETAVRGVKKKPERISAVGAPVFEITTDAGDHWTSVDGLHWKRK